MKNSEKLMNVMRDVMAQWPRVDLKNRHVFLSNLVFMHRVIIASESLLEEAVVHAKGALHGYLSDHLEEERRHDEWLAEDLASAGIDVAGCQFPSEAVAAAGTQYYLIRHVDPCALLGYMAVLECFPMPMEQLVALEEVHGKQLCRTLRHHAEHDVDHADDLLERIDSLNDRQFALVVQNAVQTAIYIGSAISKFEVQ
ncbi:iron-containing redox enzyme family protein [Burkholderia sp. B21-007]|uniref:iron-containing redox enzyme family protein n=1 Tax=Burkholderia sp. B21-007 TaxID=2890407 RepID=UPI001E32493F|nr:iron-containing redox enzyme family protein [Burkholderia sp. B21-007]UEP31616.1 iron-containing redox enzyme family protein [Burkholderia sp. B21-007]